MTKRSLTRTWHPESVPPAPVAQVQDPAVREILKNVSRSLKAISAAIDQRCGKAEADDG